MPVLVACLLSVAVFFITLAFILNWVASKISVYRPASFTPPPPAVQSVWFTAGSSPLEIRCWGYQIEKQWVYFFREDGEPLAAYRTQAIQAITEKN